MKRNKKIRTENKILVLTLSKKQIESVIDIFSDHTDSSNSLRVRNKFRTEAMKSLLNYLMLQIQKRSASSESAGKNF